MLTVKQGDLRPYVDMWLEQPAGVPIPDLDTATAIVFKMRRNDAPTTEGPSVTGACEVVDVATAHVRYRWVAGDTDVKGIFNVEVEVTQGGEPFTVPTEGWEQVQINDDLDPDPPPA